MKRENTGPRPYDLRIWRDRIRPAKLEADPLCQMRTHCKGDEATEVHHDDGNKWNMADGNLVSACNTCHSAHTATTQSFGNAKPRRAQGIVGLVPVLG